VNETPVLRIPALAITLPSSDLGLLIHAADGRVVLSMRRPLHHGTTAVAFTPMEPMKRLAASVTVVPGWFVGGPALR
jgi:hypothetical protein